MKFINCIEINLQESSFKIHSSYEEVVNAPPEINAADENNILL